MPATKNSKPARTSRLAFAGVLLGLAALSAGAVWFFHSRGQILYYGDAEAHLNIARRVFDSRTPGWEEIGSVWLPLLHVLMLPFVGDPRLWQSGLAGSIPSAAGFVVAGAFLFASVRRLLGEMPALAAVAVFAFNPNLLYLQSIPMTEPLFLAALAGMLYCSLRGWAVAAGVCALAGTLTRYEGWFLLPFVALYLALTAQHRVRALLIFGALAALGPLWWLAHNWYYFADPLYFYRGPYSAVAIQGGRTYPGLGDWSKAFLYYRTAAALCAGAPLFWLGVAGTAAALARRAFWPVLLLALPGAFYVWSLHSSGTPIYIPTLWPHTWYNSRYGVVLLPLLALGCAALVSFVPPRFRAWAAGLVVLTGISPWLLHPSPERWVTWKESQVNSESRRAWTRQAADYLRPRYRRGAGVYTSFGDLSGIWRTLGVPLRDTFTGDNHLPWDAAFRRPDLFLREEWAVAMGGDKVQTVVTRAHRPYPNYPDYTLVETIAVKGAPVIEIYRRAGRWPTTLAALPGGSPQTPDGPRP